MKPQPDRKSTRHHRLNRLLCLMSSLSLVACSSPPPTSTAPYASPSATAFPSAAPSVAASATPQASATAAPSAMPSASATAILLPASTRPRPSASPSVIASPSPTPGLVATGPDQATQDLRRNFFQNYGINPFVEASTDSLSTFAADVDTAAYAVARSYLNANQLPPAAAIRTEEFLNAFNYHYAQPLNGKFAIYTDLAPSYFGEADTRLLRVGIQGQEVLDKNRKQASLTLAIDVSGSMNRENRLELVKQSLHLLVEALRPGDRIGIVKYGTQAGVALESTDVSNKARILSVIDSLRPEGSTNAEAGLDLAYAQASKALLAGAINRVILCSDGVANVGATGPEKILSTIQNRKADGITLTTLGFGMQGYNDTLMEQLANQGDGNYAYIDTLDEAKKLLVSQLTSTLQVIARDARIQVAFNPQLVDQYRLLGYENRDIADQNFRNDQVDAGEIGSNHSVTALYEVRFKADATAGQVASITLRYKDVDAGDQIKELNSVVQAGDALAFSNSSGSFRLASAVAEFAEILRNSIFARNGKLSDVASLLETAQKTYPSDTQIQELVTLVKRAAQLQQPTTVQSTTQIVAQSKKPDQNPQAWESFLLRQLGGKGAQ